MHGKKIYINKSMYSIQGIKAVGKSLPQGLKTILKKGGHNYSSIINNWVDLVGKKVSNVCYPKSIKTGRELKNGVLFLNVTHGDQVFVEYQKNDIIDKINTFFGYKFIKEIRLVLLNKKNEKKVKDSKKNNENTKYQKKIDEIDNLNLRKNLSNLIDVFNNKK